MVPEPMFVTLGPWNRMEDDTEIENLLQSHRWRSSGQRAASEPGVEKWTLSSYSGGRRAKMDESHSIW